MMLRKTCTVSIFVIAASIIALITMRLSAESTDEWLEAGQFVQELSAHWNAEEYQQAKDKIEAKLAAKPGWLPAVILKSAYYRYIEVDCDTALAVLETIEGTVASLDPDTYANFIAAYTIYKHALEAEAAENFTEQEKNARRELAREIFVYFPGSEIVALYFALISG